MSSSINEDNMFGRQFLDSILEWIGSNMDPESVFSEKRLSDWARAWAKEQAEWIPDPDKWAAENNYVKSDSLGE